MVLQAIEMSRPELSVRVEPLVEVGQGLGANSVEPALRVGAGFDQPCILEHAEVLRHGRLAEGKGGDELSNRPLAVAQQLENRNPTRFGQNL
jgi:hypothetical protein